MSEHASSFDDDQLPAETADELETIETAYETLLEGTDELTVDVEDALGDEVRRSIELLGRARRWEQKIEHHQQGVLNHSQLQEQVDEDAYAIEAQISRARREINTAIESTMALADVLPMEAATTLEELTDLLQGQSTQLDELETALDVAHKEMLDDGMMWME